MAKKHGVFAGQEIVGFTNEERVVRETSIFRLQGEEVGTWIDQLQERISRNSIDPQAVQSRMIQKEGDGIAFTKVEIRSQINRNESAFGEGYCGRVSTAEKIGSDVLIDAEGI